MLLLPRLCPTHSPMPARRGNSCCANFCLDMPSLLSQWLHAVPGRGEVRAGAPPRLRLLLERLPGAGHPDRRAGAALVRCAIFCGAYWYATEPAARRLTPSRMAMQVAIKRVADVLNSPDQAKRALREICILRRMRHPNIIGLRDAFSRPSSTGDARALTAL